MIPLRSQRGLCQAQAIEPAAGLSPLRKALEHSSWKVPPALPAGPKAHSSHSRAWPRVCPHRTSTQPAVAWASLQHQTQGKCSSSCPMGHIWVTPFLWGGQWELDTRLGGPTELTPTWGRARSPGQDMIVPSSSHFLHRFISVSYSSHPHTHNPRIPEGQ